MKSSMLMICALSVLSHLIVVSAQAKCGKKCENVRQTATMEVEREVRENSKRVSQEAKRVGGRENCSMSGNCTISCPDGKRVPEDVKVCDSAVSPGPQSPRAPAARTSRRSGNGNPKSDKGSGAKKDGKKDNDPTQASGLPVGQLAQQTPEGQCDYGGNTALTDAFYKSKNECDRSYRQAAQVCNAEKNNEIKQALGGARAAGQKVVAAAKSGQSILQVCNDFTKASDRLKDALNSYQRSCIPRKDDCENKCMSASKSAKSISSNLSNNLNCIGAAGSMIRDLGSHSDEAKDKLMRCYDYRTPLEQAQNDAKQLNESMGLSSLCEKQSTENCRLDPATGACVIRKGQGSQFTGQVGAKGFGGGHYGQLGTEALHEPFGQIESVDSAGSGSTNGATGAMGATGGSDDGVDFSEEFENFQKKPGAVGASGDNKKGANAGRKGRSRGSSYSSRGRRRSYRGSKYKFKNYESRKLAGKGKKGSGKKNSDLKKFLPGGSKDPRKSDIGIDGITSAMGPSIFEKISRRYKLYEHRLLVK